MKDLTLSTGARIRSGAVWDGYFHGLRTGVLDIETTGLNPRRDRFVLGGLYDGQTGVLHQVFAESVEEEAETLQAFARLIDDVDMVVTYNGRHFDMPFLAERMRRAGTRALAQPYDLDLYRMVDKYSPLRRLLPNLKQKSVENYMGFWQDRTDEISGVESVELYYEYTRTKNPALEEKILLHNRDDVEQLTRLTKITEKCDVHRAMGNMGFPVRLAGGCLKVKRIRPGRDQLIIEGTQGRLSLDYRCYERDGCPVQAAFDGGSGDFRVVLPLIRRDGLAMVDLRAAGVAEEQFARYPAAGSGFLVLENNGETQYRETNHFVRAFLQRLAPDGIG
ncbi:MAG: ribonuclease H-like domain-containing protein [Bacillota bacterium]|nr:ribonuclease H-like domain-containing protein [Bacillota bacterium]